MLAASGCSLVDNPLLVSNVLKGPRLVPMSGPLILATSYQGMKMKPHITSLLTAIFLLLTGCSEQPELQDEPPLQLERSFTLQETDALFIGDFRAVTVATDPFRMYIPDHVTGRVIVADSTGALIKRIGSFGQGPGEMTQPMHVEVLNDRLYVVDLAIFCIRHVEHLPAHAPTAGRTVSNGEPFSHQRWRLSVPGSYGCSSKNSWPARLSNRSGHCPT